MKTVLCIAQDFGFGPVSKLLAISENLQNVRKIFFGQGVALELARYHAFDEIHECGRSDYEHLRTLLKPADLVVNVMDFPLTPLVKSIGCRYFLIDSLAWFWPELPSGAELADSYFCQNFFGHGVAQKVREYRLENAQIIGPIINTNFRRSAKKDQVIVNFGGLENPYVKIGENSDYPFIMLAILLPILQSRFAQILVTGRERVMRMCRDRFSDIANCRFVNLAPRMMLEELYCSQALFTTPGIQTIYDAADKLPIFCLPPQNDSNIRNLRVLTEHQVIKHYLAWEEVAAFPAHDERPIEQVFAILLQTIAQFGQDNRQQDVLRSRVRSFLEARAEWGELVQRQKQAVESLGKPGTETVTQAIQAALFPPGCTAAVDPVFVHNMLCGQKI